jgi:hypothetical protein
VTAVTQFNYANSTLCSQKTLTVQCLEPKLINSGYNCRLRKKLLIDSCPVNSLILPAGQVLDAQNSC